VPSTNDSLVEKLATDLQSVGQRVAVAESLTCGRVVSALGAGPDAVDWLAGAVVAYAPDVKFDVLGVEPGPVITAACARQLAAGVANLLRADIGIGITGCGGPDPEEGQPPGTVFMATSRCDQIDERTFLFTGPPDRVLDQAVTEALRLLDEICTNPQPRS
jgi:nicotinamide-nucleotide amidase